MRLGFYLRHCGNLHYFAAIRPYVDHFVREPGFTAHLVVRELDAALAAAPEYAGYRHLITDDCDLDRYDLVVTPTFLREEERTGRTRAVQVFHGMSDKPFTYEHDFSDYLCTLCVGWRQLGRLLAHERNRKMRWQLIGYPKFDAPQAAPWLFDNDRATIIYCPTWRKGGLSSLERVLGAPRVVERLTQRYNVIVKPHANTLNPARECYDAALVRALEELPGVRLVRSGDAMPWFAQADLYIGDISTSGYEWLYFGQPMVFLNPQPGQLAASSDPASLTYLWQCGEVCDDVQALPDVVAARLVHDAHAVQRKAVLDYSVFDARGGRATARGCEAIRALAAAPDPAPVRSPGEVARRIARVVA